MIWSRLRCSNMFSRFIRVELLSSFKGVLRPVRCSCFKITENSYGSSTGAGSGFREVSNWVTIDSRAVLSTIVNCPSDLYALSFFLWCARQRDYFHDRYAFACMVDVVVRLVERFKSVDGVVRELQRTGHVVKAQTFLLLLRIFWQGGFHVLVFDVLDAMCQMGYKPNTFAWNVVMDIHFRSGKTDDALKALRASHAPNFLSFNIVLGYLCKSNDLINLKLVLRDMLRAGYYPNVDILVKILNCFAQKGRLDESFQVLGLMVSLGFQASLVVWNILIHGFCKMGKPEMASYMLEKMINVGCCPNIMTFTSLFKGFMELEMVNDAFRIRKMMECQGYEIDLVLFNVMINCYSKVGRYDDALAIFSDLKAQNLEPDSFTFSSLISCLCSSGNFDIMPKLLDGLSVPLDLVVCNSLLRYCCKAGLPMDAIKLSHDMLGPYFTPDKYSYMGLLDALCRADKIDDALHFYRGMLVSGFHLEAHVHTVIISGLIRAHRYHDAFCLFREAISKHYPLDVVSYTVVIHGLVGRGKVQEAFTFYNKMKSLGMVHQARTHNIMLHGFCKERDPDRVIQILQQMLVEEVQLDYRRFMKILDIMFRSRHYHLIFDTLINMWDSKLMPKRAIRVLLLEGLSHGIKVHERHYPLLGEISPENSDTDISCYEEPLEIAASVH